MNLAQNRAWALRIGSCGSKDVVDVFDDDGGFRQGASVVDKNGDFTVDRVEVGEERGLVEDIFLSVFELQ